MTTPAAAPDRVELLSELAATRTGTLWLARINGGPTRGVEVIDPAVAAAAGIDLRILEHISTLQVPSLALPGPLLDTPRGPGLPLSAAMGRPLVLAGPVGDPAALAGAAATLARALAALHAVGLTHNAINPSTLCPGLGGTPQLAVTAACALPGTQAADVAALIAALPSVDALAASTLAPLLLAAAGLSASELAVALTGVQLSPTALTALSRVDATAPTDGAGLQGSQAPPAPPPVNQEASPADQAGAWTPVITPAAGMPADDAAAEPTVKAWGPAVTAPALGQTPPVVAARRIKPARQPRRTRGAAGGTGAGAAQVIRDHPAFLVVGGLVVLLAIADLTLLVGHHHGGHTPVAPAAATAAAPHQSASPAVAATPATVSAAPTPPVVAAAPPPPSATTAVPSATPSAATAAARRPSPHPTHHAATHRPTAAPSTAAVVITRVPARALAPASPEPVATGTVPTPGTEESAAAVATGTVAPPS